MTKRLLSGLMICGLLAGGANATTVWNPAGNGIVPPATGDWGDAVNWTNGVPGAPDTKAVFNVPGAAECVVTSAYSGFQVVQGDNNPGGVMRVASGGSIVTLASNWSAIGYNNVAHTIVEAGGSFSFGDHAWIGLNDGAVGTLDIAGVVNVGGMLGLGWGQTTSQGFVNILDGGLLALSNIHSDGSTSIKHGSLLNIAGTGQLTLPGDFTGTLQKYIDNGLIVGNGVASDVELTYDADADKTFATAIPEPSTLGLLGAFGALGFLRRRRS